MTQVCKTHHGLLRPMFLGSKQPGIVGRSECELCAVDRAWLRERGFIPTIKTRRGSW